MAGKYKIEKMEIPDIITITKGAGPPRKYPFPTMEIGDGFSVDSAKALNSVRSAAATWGHYNNVKFTTRKTATGGVIIRIE